MFEHNYLKTESTGKTHKLKLITSRQSMLAIISKAWLTEKEEAISPAENGPFSNIDFKIKVYQRSIILVFKFKQRLDLTNLVDYFASMNK